jgi:hypothetical protein
MPGRLSALDRGEWSESRPDRALAPGKGPPIPGTHCTGGWVGPRAGLDTEVRGKILSPLQGSEPRSLGRPDRSQTLYCLSYPAHKAKITFIKLYRKLNRSGNKKIKKIVRYVVTCL